MSCSGKKAAATLALIAISSAGVYASPQNVGGLRTFTIEKPPAPDPDEAHRQSDLSAAAPRLPQSTDSLLSTVGLGYVQGADWGLTLHSAGGVAGLQVQLESLVTHGFRGAKFDRGSLLVADPDRGWRAEAGDVFS